MFKHASLRGRRSFALVIVLCLVVLLLGVVLAIFSSATLQRQIGNSSANQTRTEIFAQGALDTIVGDIKQEIAAGSVTTTVNGITIYTPMNNGTNSTSRSYYMDAIPSFQGFAPAYATAVDSKLNQETDGLNNLLKVSCASNAANSSASYYFSTNWAGRTTNQPILGVKRGSAILTSTASLNGRSISNKRWNKPLLLPPASTTDFTPPIAFPTPTWIYVTHDGSNPTTLDKTTSVTTSNVVQKSPKYIVGRYAYAIYNEGGLLDVTVAGYPNSMAPDFTSKRGMQPQVDLASLPGNVVPGANSLVQWRNPASIASGYANMIQSTNGFTSVAAGDQTFISRQQLIQYALANSSQITPQALQYLTTFSRELNTPSYSPPPLGTPARPSIKTGQGPGGANSVGYGNDNAFNPSLVNIRVTTPFTSPRMDGTTPVVGEPLIKSRFPLSRLSWIGHLGPTNGGTSAQIVASFGLRYTPSPNPLVGGTWTYNHGAGDRILKLSEVADQGREPDFFELLQAGIYIGSLGRGGPVDDTSMPLFNTVGDFAFNCNPYYQIIQIGANLIDQYDTDSYPTRILFDTANTSHEFAGIENLPYLYATYKVAYRFHGSAEETGINYALNPDADHLQFPRVGLWYQPCVWNPHADAPTFFSSGAYQGPQRFRYMIVGSDKLVCSPDPTGNLDPGVNGIVYGATTDFSSSAGIQFFNNLAFAQPTVLVTGKALNGNPIHDAHALTIGATAAGNDVVNDEGATPPTSDPSPTSPNPPIGMWTYHNPSPYGIYDYPLDESGVSSDSGKFIGINVGIVTAADKRLRKFNETSPLAFSYYYVSDIPQPKIYHTLQYLAEDGQTWVTYSEIKNQREATSYDDLYAGNRLFLMHYPHQAVLRVGLDPRTDRFGGVDGETYGGTVNSINQIPGQYGRPYPTDLGTGFPGFNPNLNAWDNDTFRPLPGPTLTAMENRVGLSSGTYMLYAPFINLNAGYQYFLGTFAENRNDFINLLYPTVNNPTASPNVHQYAEYSFDPDYATDSSTGTQIPRPADGAYATSITANGGYPLATTDSASRPIILNRPFRSVAEMGYACRDMPWKHLDFFTQYSADAALLDIFCVNESPLVTAGKVDLNTRQTPVIQALLTGAIISDGDNTTIPANGGTISAGTLATNYMALLGYSAVHGFALTDSSQTGGPTGPILNRNQLVTRWSGALATNNIGGGSLTPAVPALTPSPDSVIKRHREAPIRVLAEMGSTRTWNLLIDCISQTGRLTPSSATLDQFTVEGESRAWLHVAIDRYTGKVISQYIEPVYE